MRDTVKLIIEIPKDRYTDILRIADIQIVRRIPTLEQVVAHGIPLDDVKFNIEHMACRQYEHRLMLDRQEVIEILDNIGKAESENKE